MHIVLHIDRLVLDGVHLDAGEHRALRRAITDRLSEMVVQQGLAPSLLGSGAVPTVSGATITLEPGASGARLGGQIAGAVYSGIGGTRP